MAPFPPIIPIFMQQVSIKQTISEPLHKTLHSDVF